MNVFDEVIRSLSEESDSRQAARRVALILMGTCFVLPTGWIFARRLWRVGTLHERMRRSQRKRQALGIAFWCLTGVFATAVGLTGHLLLLLGAIACFAAAIILFRSTEEAADPP